MREYNQTRRTAKHTAGLTVTEDEHEANCKRENVINESSQQIHSITRVASNDDQDG